MVCGNGFRGSLLAAFALAGVVITGATGAAETPAPASDQREANRQQLLNAFAGSRAAGQCQGYGELRKWQESAWPAGKAVLDGYFLEVVLAYWAPQAERAKPDALQSLTPKFDQLCNQATPQYQQALQGLKPAAGAAPPPEEAATARRDMASALESAYHFGECGTYVQWLDWLQMKHPSDRERALKFLEGGYFVRMDYAKYKESFQEFHNACELAGAKFGAYVDKLRTQP